MADGFGGFDGFRGFSSFSPISEAEMQLRPYLEEERAKQKKKRSLLRPVEALFDLLSRGQYLTANVAQDVGRRIRGEEANILKGAWEGITGERKGDWRTTLFGGQDVGGPEVKGLWANNPEWMEKKAKVPIIGPTSAEDVVGFLANVFIDPLNFITFGASKAGKAAAREFAEQSVKLAMKDIGKLDDIGKIAKGFSRETFDELLEKGPAAAGDYLQKFTKKTDLSRYFNSVYKDAYRNALTMTPESAAAKLTGGVSEAGKADLIEKGAGKLAQVAPNTASVLGVPAGPVQRMLGQPAGERFGSSIFSNTQDIYQKALTAGAQPVESASEAAKQVFRSVAEYGDEMGKAPEFVKELAGLGQHGLRLFGQEVGLHPAGSLAKGYQSVVTALEKSAPGRLFEGALWSLYNNPASPVQWIRKMFGFRNPYETILNAKKQSLRYGYHWYADNEAVAVKEALEGVDDATLNSVRDVLNIAAEDTSGVDIQTVIAGIFNNPKLAQNVGIDVKNADKIREAVEKVRALTQKWADIEHKRGEQGLMSVFDNMDAYLPTYKQRVSPAARGRSTTLGSDTPAFTLSKTFTQEQTARQEAAKLKWLLGLNDESAMAMVKKANISSFNMDIKEMLTQRALAHAHAMTTADMVEQFRQFGIKFAPQPDEALEQALTRMGGDVAQLGLQPVKHEALKGYFFDNHVAEIIDRVVAVAGSDDGLGKFGKITNWFSQWWKGMATLSPGFLIRNDRTNRFLLFVKNGAKSLDPRQGWRAFVGAMYALHGEAGLKKARIPMDAAMRTLNETIGGKTVRELAEQARKTGVVSKRVMGFDMASSVEAYTKDVSLMKRLNPFSTENIAFEKSHELNAIIESTPKLQSMLMDLEDMTKATGSDITPAMMQFADHEAKKWFFDYDDISDTERQVFRKIIPFYCVPDLSEILTRTGWKRYPDLVIGEEVLTYNIKTGMSEWQPVQDVAVFDFDGDLVRLKNNSYADFLCTEDHRWPVVIERAWQKSSVWAGEKWYDRAIVRTHELNTNNRLIMAAPLSESKSLLSPRDAAILGWVVTDGYHRWRGNYLEMMIYQAPHKYANEIRALLGDDLTSEAVHPQTGVICFRIGAAVSRRLRKVFKSKDDLPGIVCNLSDVAAESMRDAMFKAEGMTWDDGARAFAQVPGPVLDAFQILCQFAGEPFCSHKNPKSPCANGYIRRSRICKVSALKKSRVHYSGKIWCPKTENSTWVMRQGRSIACTGNTWIRKSIALNAANMVHYKEMYSMVPKFQRMIDEDKVSLESLPEYMREESYIPIGEEDGKARVVNPALPYADLNAIPFRFEMGEGGIPIPRWSPGEIKDQFLSMAHPSIKTALALWGSEKGWDPFRKRELDAQAPAPRALRLIANNPGVLAFLDSALRFANIEDGLNMSDDGKGHLLINAKVQFLLENNFPMLNRLQQVADLPLTAFPELEEALAKQTGFKDRYEGINRVFKTLSFWAGVTQAEVDQDQEALWRFRDELRKAERARSKDNENTPATQVRRAKYAVAARRREQRLMR